jgi:menaquinone-specific isochorismate synthase
MAPKHVPYEALEPEPARQTLAELVERVFADALTASAAGRALRIEIPLQPVNAPAWLQAQETSERVYWGDRERAFEVAGIGAADVVADTDGAPDRILERILPRLGSAHPHLRYYGGLRFNAGAAARGAWQDFRGGRFVLPRVELLNEGGQTYLACNILAGDALDDVEEAIEEVRFPETDEGPATPEVRGRSDRPDRAGWDAMIDQALELFGRSGVRKLVLARETTFALDEAPDPVGLLRRLTDRADRAYAFLFQPGNGVAFLGATPERLYRRQGRYIESEAVAGTRPRGATEAEDAALGRDLLESDKDVREHRYVVDALREAFGRLCGSVQDGRVELLPLPECQHLYCRFEGILAEPYSDAAILRALHPTPAVGGYPTEGAADWIAALEPFDRGWYAGPVGWVSREAAEFAVALRCGLVDGASLRVYTGAGIVVGSTTAGEWAEIENKMQKMSGVLGGHDR